MRHAGAESGLLKATYIGYESLERYVDLVNTTELTLLLRPSATLLNPIIVTASRRHEKILEAPAATSVIQEFAITEDATPSSVSLLQDVVSADVAQTGIDRYEISLRGFNNVFTGAPHVMIDYRQGAMASLGVNYYTLMPIANIDLKRVEIVGGPGAALYGAGVDGGVIHFLTKDPFNDPGTTVSVGLGERSLFSAAARHAAVLNENLGYKLVAQRIQGDEWEFDRSNSVDQEQIDDWVRPPDYDNWKHMVSGSVYYRTDRGASLVMTGGLTSNKGMGQTPTGTSLSDGWQYSFAQVRYLAGPLFAQGYFNHSNGGDTFNYATGVRIIDHSSQVGLEAQYEFDLGDRLQNVVGVDIDSADPDTEGSINGRFEKEDAVTTLGSYVQTSTPLSDLTRLTVALRGDYNNVDGGFEISPRAALVRQVHPNHSVRLTYNRAHSIPDNVRLHLDIPVLRQELGGPYRLILQGLGSKDGYSFDNYRMDGLATMIIPAPGLFGAPAPATEFPLAPIYGGTAAQLAAQLDSDAALPPPFDGLNTDERGELAQLLLQTQLDGVTRGDLGFLNVNTAGYTSVPGPVDVDQIARTITQTFEIGYKGLFANRIVATTDLYLTRRKNFGGQLEPISPFVFLPDVANDLGGQFAAAMADSELPGGFTPEALGATIGALTAAQLASQPVAVIEPDQQVLAEPNPESVAGFLAFRDFGNTDVWGVDLSVDVALSERLGLTGSLSYASDDLFDEDELGEPGTGLSLAMNAPKLRLKAGARYRDPRGVHLGLRTRYRDGFPMASGPFVGRVKSRFLIDANLGWEVLAASSRVNLTIRNLLNNKHRDFVGTPKVGRLAMIRFTHTI